MQWALIYTCQPKGAQINLLLLLSLLLNNSQGITFYSSLPQFHITISVRSHNSLRSVTTICPPGRHLEVTIYVDLSDQANVQEVYILH